MKYSRIVLALFFSFSLANVSNACERKLTLDDFEPYLSADFITQKVREVAANIDADYVGKDIMLISVLEGAKPFTKDLTKELKTKTHVAEVTAKSYEGTESGKLTITGLENINCEGKHVVINDDICDTTQTLRKLIEQIQAKKPASIKTCVLLLKKTKRNSSFFRPDYVAIEIPDKFVIGYGLDLDGQYRELPDVRALKG